MILTPEDSTSPSSRGERKSFRSIDIQLMTLKVPEPPRTSWEDKRKNKFREILRKIFEPAKI